MTTLWSGRLLKSKIVLWLFWEHVFFTLKKNKAVDGSCFSVLKTFPLDPWNLGIGSEKWSSHQASEMTHGDPIMGLFKRSLPSDPNRSHWSKARSSWRRFCKTSPWRRWSKTSCPRGSDHFTIVPHRTCRVWNREGEVHAEHSTWLVKLCESVLIYLLSNCIKLDNLECSPIPETIWGWFRSSFYTISKSINTPLRINACPTRYF